MKLQFLNVAVTAGLISMSGFAHLAYAADMLPTAVCQAKNAVNPGSCITVAEWRNANDDFGGLKQTTFADDLFLTVSDSGIYEKTKSYEMLPGYHWATFEEMETRLNAFVAANGTDDLKNFNYHGQGGWDGYKFPNSAGDLVDRRYFIFNDTATNSRVMYAGIREYVNLTSSNNTRVHYSNSSVTASNWAGFVMIPGDGVEQNFAPSVTLAAQQNDKLISVIDAQSGVVTVTAAIHDWNQLDGHTVTWDVGTGPLVDLNNDNIDNTFEFDASSLDAGTYSLSVNVTEANTTETFSAAADVNLVIEASLAALSADTDADNDGLSDLVEGYTDSDQDGIADYLDDNNDTSLLPVGAGQSMQTVSGLKLSLGDIARSSNSSAAADASISYDDIATNGSDNGGAVDNANDTAFNALSSIVNFTVSGLFAPGDTAVVVIPLASGEFIPAGAVYRKYTETTGWFTFIEDAKNSIKSALKDGSGNCPAPFSTDYVNGLITDNDCIQLIIEDGGANDADGMANAVVKDPGVLALVKNLAPNIVVETSVTVDEESDVILDASATTDAENEDLTYLWTQLTGTSVTLSGENSPVLSFTAPSIDASEVLTFQLIVTDGSNLPTVNVDVTVAPVNEAPTVTIDGRTFYDEAELVALTALGVDVNADDISYQWEQVSGPTITITDPAAAKITFLAPLVAADTTMEFMVTVSDGVETVSETAVVVIANREPLDSSGGGSMSWMLALIAVGAFRRKLFN